MCIKPTCNKHTQKRQCQKHFIKLSTTLDTQKQSAYKEKRYPETSTTGLYHKGQSMASYTVSTHLQIICTGSWAACTYLESGTSKGDAGEPV